MRVLFHAMIAAVLSVFSVAFVSDANAQVDLRGKKGIPEDLKKYDPPKKSLKTKEPPSPTIEDERGKDFPKLPPGGGGGESPGGTGGGVYVPPSRRAR